MLFCLQGFRSTATRESHILGGGPENIYVAQNFLAPGVWGLGVLGGLGARLYAMTPTFHTMLICPSLTQ